MIFIRGEGGFSHHEARKWFQMHWFYIIANLVHVVQPHNHKPRSQFQFSYKRQQTCNFKVKDVN